MIDPIFINTLTGLPLEYQRITETELRRRLDMKKAFDAYAGQSPVALKPAEGEPDDNVRLAWPRLIVDKGVNWLFGKDLNFELRTGERSEDEQWLNEALPMEQRMTTLQKVATNGAIAGHAFVKLIAADPYPRWIVLDPLTVTPTFNPDDLSEVVRWKIEYPAVSPATGHPITFTQVHERSADGRSWTVQDRTTDNNSRVISETTYVWPYPWAQIHHCQNLPAANEFWGEPDLNTEILTLHGKIELVASNTTKMTRIYANPVLWVAGLTLEDGEEIDLTPGGVLLLPDPEMRLNVAQPEPDIKASLDLYTRFIDDLHSFAHIPKIATDATQGQQIGRASGSAMRYHYTPIIERTELKRRTYGAMVAELVVHTLLVAGRAPSGVRLVWSELVPDPSADIERARALLDLGVSRDTAWRTAGIADPDGELEKVAAEGGPMNEQDQPPPGGTDDTPDAQETP